MGKKGKKDVDAEADFHGYTSEQMRLALERHWSEWKGLRVVRIITGQGDSLKPELNHWCNARGIPYSSDGGNEGSTRIYPNQRTVPDATLTVTLKEKGLRLTPEQEAYLRDPAAIERAKQEERKRKEAEERKRLADEATRAAQRKRDEALWQAEILRLNKLDHQRAPMPTDDRKPAAPVILPPSEMKHQEGFWRAEIVRVADTEHEQLKKEKITGLDKLAPPLEPKPKPKEPPKPKVPERDNAADRALFEAEMERLMNLE